MHPIIAAALGAASLCATIAFHIARTNFELVVPFSEWFLNRGGFKFPFYAITALIGIMFMTAGRKGSQVADSVEKCSESIRHFYASASGSILGWVLGVCAVAVLENATRYWLISLLLAAMTFFIVSAPLVGFMVTHKTVTDFNNRMFRDKWREKYIHFAGLALLALAIVWVVHDLQT